MKYFKVFILSMFVSAGVNAQPAITSFTPTSGPAGQTVMINGANFSPVAANNIVFFGGAKATVLSASATTIFVTVPTNATYQPITVSTGGFSVASATSFDLTFNGGTFDPVSFYDAYSTLGSNYGNSDNCVFADIDGDGRTDILVNVHATVLSDPSPIDSFAVFRNTTVNGDISFAPRVEFKTTGNLALDVHVADFDGDGKLDVVSINSYLTNGGPLNIFKNTSTPGNISFTAPISIAPGIDGRNVSTGDLDGDGKPDLVLTSVYNLIYVFRNTSAAGAISFGSMQTFLTISGNNNKTVSTYIADIDGDGKNDIIAPSSTTTKFSVFKNISTAGSINMDTRADFEAGGTSNFITSADMDGDGKTDIILGGGFYNDAGDNDSTIVVIRNKSTPGNFNFDPVTASLRAAPWNVGVADLDGDGKPDLFASEDLGHVIRRFKNNSTPGLLAFSGAVNYNLTPYYFAGVAAGDLDGDGKPEIGATDNHGNDVHILLNRSGGDKTICPNGSLVLITNFYGSTYQWQKNTGTGYANLVNGPGVAGASSYYLSLSNLSSSWYGYKYRCLISGVPGEVFILKFGNTWTGAVNSAWETPGNWSCGTVPDANTDVIINSGTVVVSSNVFVKSLRIDASVNFTIAAGGNITFVP